MNNFDRSIRHLFALAALALFAIACNATMGAPQNGDAGTKTDASTSVSCSPACSSNEVCSNGQCVALPSSCPCPLDSYCDLSSNSCVAGCSIDSNCQSGEICDDTTCRQGCRADGDCSGGKICDASSETCRAGCRADTDCSSTQYCNTGNDTCDSGCRADGDTCGQQEVYCQAHVCYHEQGAACADDGNPCTADVYDANNNCTHPALPAGSACADDGNECTDDVCNGSGTCTHDAYPTAMDCGTGNNQQCNGTTCATFIAFCGDIQSGDYVSYFNEGSAQPFIEDATNCGCTDDDGPLFYFSGTQGDNMQFRCGTCTGTATQNGTRAVCWQ